MRRPSTRALVLVGLALAVLLAGVVSFYASTHPDGLEYVAAHAGFGGSQHASAAERSPLAGYSVHGIADGRLAGGLAGVVGVLVVAVLAFGLMRLLARRSDRDD